jgi:hypothetical protein
MFDHVVTIPPMEDDSVRKGTGGITKDEAYQQNLLYMIQGNPGAMTVVREMHEKDPAVAPLCLGMLAAFDIKGPMLWLLYKDVNKQDVFQMMAMIQNGDEAPAALEALPYSGYKRPVRK